MADEKKSPWLNKQEVQAADLPDEVYESKVDDDDKKIERAIANARVMDTKVPPPDSWQTCWACGKKVPMRFRDAMFGILVCRRCLWTSVQHSFFENFEGLFGGIGDYINSLNAHVDDDDDDDDDYEDEETEYDGGDEHETPGEEVPLDDVDAPEVPQSNTPQMVKEEEQQQQEEPEETDGDQKAE